jgi:hypothetical protein
VRFGKRALRKAGASESGLQKAAAKLPITMDRIMRTPITIAIICFTRIERASRRDGFLFFCAIIISSILMESIPQLLRIFLERKPVFPG